MCLSIRDIAEYLGIHGIYVEKGYSPHAYFDRLRTCSYVALEISGCFSSKMEVYDCGLSDKGPCYF